MMDRVALACLAILSLTIPDPPFSTLPHSHSIVLSDDNALTFQRNFFLRTAKNRLLYPSEICALDFKQKFRRSAICSVSATIDNARTIFASSITRAHCASAQKIPSTPASRQIPGTSL